MHYHVTCYSESDKWTDGNVVRHVELRLQLAQIYQVIKIKKQPTPKT